MTKKHARSLVSLTFCFSLIMPPILLAEQPALGPGVRDPFAQASKRAMDLDRQWQFLDSQLPTRLARLEPCDPKAVEAIQETSRPAQQALTAQAAYWKLWSDFAGGESRRFAQVMADRSTIQSEIQSSLETAKKGLGDLQTRREQLPEEATASHQVLGSLKNNLENRVENLQGALKLWEEAQRYSTDARSRTQILLESIQKQQELLASATLLWQAFYDAQEIRAGLNCTAILEPTVFPQRKPRY
jgi:hypothetical protein